MKIIYLTVMLFMALCGENSFAQRVPRVTFLVSLKDSAPDSLQRKFRGSLYSQIERTIYGEFTRYYGPANVRVLFDAEQTNLWNEIHDPNNEAIFWVSHSGELPESAGVASNGIILNSRGEDISAVLASSRPGPGLRYVGIVGCRSKKFVDSLKWNEKYPNLVVQAEAQKVELFKALKKSIATAKIILMRPAVYSNAMTSLPSSSSSLIVLRKVPITASIDAMASVRIELKGKVLGVFPPGIPGEIQSMQIGLPETTESEAASIKFIANSGIYALAPESPNPAIGDIQIADKTGKLRWNVLRMNGKPLGVTQHVLIFSVTTP
jgi:hypothetical protein